MTKMKNIFSWIIPQRRYDAVPEFFGWFVEYHINTGYLYIFSSIVIAVNFKVQSNSGSVPSASSQPYDTS